MSLEKIYVEGKRLSREHIFEVDIARGRDPACKFSEAEREVDCQKRIHEPRTIGKNFFLEKTSPHSGDVYRDEMEVCEERIGIVLRPESEQTCEQDKRENVRIKLPVVQRMKQRGCEIE